MACSIDSRGAVRAATLGLTLGLVATLASCSVSDKSSGLDAGDAGRSGDAGGLVAWRQVFTELPGALISVWGASEKDVWAVGSDTKDGKGPLVLHFDGADWVRRVAEAKGDLWWTHGFANGLVLVGGSNGAILRYEQGRFTAVPTPKTKGTVFGIWGSAPGDVWAVGGDTAFGTGAFVWHSDGTRFVEWTDLPVDTKKLSALYKVWGTSANDAWVVGSDGVTLHFEGQGFTRAETAIPDPLFTVHSAGGGGLVASVGGSDLGVLLERTGAAAWQSAALPDGTRQLFGVWLTQSAGWAVGADAAVLSRASGKWKREATNLATGRAFHAVWVDPSGGVWAVGGDVLTPPLGAGMLVHRGPAVPTTYTFEDTPRDGSTDAHVGAGGAPPLSLRDGGHGDSSLDGEAPDGVRGDASGSGGSGGSSAFDGGTLPGRVRCGSTTCAVPTEKCCVDSATGAPSGCVAAGTACGSSEADVTCDESADCASAGLCCVTRFIQSGLLFHVACAATCDPDPIACLSGGGCAQSQCLPFIPMPAFSVCQ
jgi:hypothetical protein